MAWLTPEMKGTIPTPRAGHTAVAVDNCIVIFGGGNAHGPTNDLFVLNTDSMTWTQPQQHGTPPTPRVGHSCTLVFKNQLLVFGILTVELRRTRSC